MLPFCAAVFFLIFMKETAVSGALYGLELCCRIVIPAIFPFTVLTKFFFNSGMCHRLSQLLRKPFGYIFGVSGNGAAVILLSLISGYPVCTSICSDLYSQGKISKSEALSLISYTNNATPSFIIGYIGMAMLQSREKGIFMYLCVILSALAYGIIVSKDLKKDHMITPQAKENTSLATAFVTSVTSGCSSAVNICGFVIVFSVIGSAIKLLPSQISSVLLLLSELTVGVGSAEILTVFSEERLLFSVLCSAVSFSGLCVMCQVRSCLYSDMHMGTYIKGKILQALLSFIISFCFFPVFF